MILQLVSDYFRMHSNQVLSSLFLWWCDQRRRPSAPPCPDLRRRVFDGCGGFLFSWVHIFPVSVWISSSLSASALICCGGASGGSGGYPLWVVFRCDKHHLPCGGGCLFVLAFLITVQVSEFQACLQ
ncbi:hypothetical protein QL285_087297 [Trifolium repens]|nr:hypothetical protein QL285_087297 [Trifolium repens]